MMTWSLLLVMVTMVTGAVMHVSDCDFDCPLNYDPVCGSDGKTYPNLCVLEGVQGCSDPDLTLDHKGECDSKDCPYGCSGQYDPVCGSDGKTYGNMCELTVAKICYDPDLTVAHKGECETTDPECPKQCYDNYDPVCGSDGNTYGNLCQLEAERDCNNKPDLTVDHEGECNTAWRH